MNMCGTARDKVDLKSPVINARYKHKVERNVKVDAARTLIDIANLFEFPNVKELESQSGMCTQTDVDQPLLEATQAELQTHSKDRKCRFCYPLLKKRVS